MERGFARELDNVLAKVGLNRLDACFFQTFVQAHFLRDHGLALNNSLHALGGGEVGYISCCLFGVFCEEDFSTSFADVFFGHPEVDVEVIDSVRLDCATPILEFVPVRGGGGCVQARLMESAV